jgi:hypothetical protein
MLITEEQYNIMFGILHFAHADSTRMMWLENNIVAHHWSPEFSINQTMIDAWTKADTIICCHPEALPDWARAKHIVPYEYTGVVEVGFKINSEGCNANFSVKTDNFPIYRVDSIWEVVKDLPQEGYLRATILPTKGLNLKAKSYYKQIASYPEKAFNW